MPWPRNYSIAKVLLALLIIALLPSRGQATPITLQQSFAGNLDFLVTGGSLRTQSNSGNSCAVTSGPVSASLSGIPSGATVRAAFLYWGGSGPTPDEQVTLDGNTVFADRIFVENYTETGINEFYFGAVADVTNLVQAKRNGSYSFSNLSVANTDVSSTQRYCTFATVYAGWSLVVVYESASQPFRVVNFYDGLRVFYGSQITLTPDNLRIPSSPVNGKLAVLTFEGDANIATSRNGFTESIRVNNNLLTDGLNPNNNQFNDTINTLGINNSWGVDLDIYNIDPYIAPGDTSITTRYSSGGDFVLLMLQVISATSDPVSDLSIRKRSNGALRAGSNGQYRITVTNSGPLAEPGPILVSDVLPGNLSYAGFSGTGWSCSATGQAVNCNHPGPLANGASLPVLSLDIAVAASAAGQSISNTATVSGQNFDNISANNSDTTTDFVYGPITGLKRLYPYFSAVSATPEFPAIPANSLSRVLPANNTSSNTFGPGGSRTLNLAPALVRPLNVIGSNSIPIPVRICSRRQGDGNSNNRDMRVSLFHVNGASVTQIGTSQSAAFNNTAWTLRTFNFFQPTSLLLSPGSQFRVVIENTTPAGAGSRLIEASTLSCGVTDVSRVELNVSTVINVEAVETHAAAYPAVEPVSSTEDDGNALYVRALISDPFGSFDITSASFELFDSDDNLVLGPTAMTLVNDDELNGQRTYQISGTVPAWQGSPYTLRVRGNEGSETGANAIFHLNASTLNVVPQPPNLLLSKLASTLSSTPGDVVRYTIEVSNPGPGDATDIEISTALPPFLTLGLDTFGAGQPIQFVDGTPATGLTPGVIQYSDDAGMTFGYLPSSGGGGAPVGFDSNVTHFLLPLSGTLPSGGNFILLYDAMVD